VVAAEGVGYQKGDARPCVSGGGRNRAEADHAQAHQESPRVLEGVGRIESADG
jgi:hypothetical protein